jgi:PTH1 family peptidyl-tRNA hydrolase
MIFKKQTNTDTYLIVGLGNPGKEYAQNRHNAGFMAVDKLAERLGVKFSRMQSNALVTKATVQNKKLILAKPRTFMNLSGQAVGALAKFYKLEKENILVVYDDVDLPFDSIRLRPEGGSGGHKGMKSIIERLGTQDFARLRIGIDRPKGQMNTPDYVLQDFSKDEIAVLPFILNKAVDAALDFVHNGIEIAMNTYNRGE